jgi:hypothetical protein
MSEYYIVAIGQEEATPCVLEHMFDTGALYDEAYMETSKPFIKWFGAKCDGILKGVLGVMTCDTTPDDLIIVHFYGTPKAIKILGEYVLRLPQKNKFGYIDVNNNTWMLALMKRGFDISPIAEHDQLGNKIHLVQVSGGQNGR